MNWKLHKAFGVVGQPIPQPRPRAVSIGGHGRVYNPKDAEQWKLAVIGAYCQSRPEMLIKCSIKLVVTFFFKPPKAGPNHRATMHVIRPDLDNLLKSTMDALTQTAAWGDDSQVACIWAQKVYADEPGALIELYKGVDDERSKLCRDAPDDVSLSSCRQAG